MGDQKLVQHAEAVSQRFMELDTKINEVVTAINDPVARLRERSPEKRFRAILKDIRRIMSELRALIPKNPPRFMDPWHNIIWGNLHRGHVWRIRKMTRRVCELQQQVDAVGDEPDKVDDDLSTVFVPGEDPAPSLQLDQERLVEEYRQEELRHVSGLAKSVMGMFLALGDLINDQGLAVDRIDSLIKESRQDMIIGNDNLTAAEDIQKGASNRAFYIYLIVAVIIILILGTIVLIKKQ